METAIVGVLRAIRQGAIRLDVKHEIVEVKQVGGQRNSIGREPDVGSDRLPILIYAARSFTKEVQRNVAGCDREVPNRNSRNGVMPGAVGGRIDEPANLRIGAAQ